jgi:hypothetical protein
VCCETWRWMWSLVVDCVVSTAVLVPSALQSAVSVVVGWWEDAGAWWMLGLAVRSERWGCVWTAWELRSVVVSGGDYA